MTGPRPPGPLEDAPRIGDWLRLSPDGRVTVLSGRVELGQGNLTAIRQMAAAELGCAPDALSIRGAHTGETPNEGFTAGSLSISAGGSAVRRAACALRQLALEAAAVRLDVSIGALELAQGRVLRNGHATGIDLAGLAGEIDLSRRVADLAQPGAARVAVPGGGRRIDLRARLAGAPFLHDLVRPGLLHGRAVHPPTLSARLAELDLAALRARDGVLAVLRDGSFVGIVAKSEVQATAAAEWARTHAAWSDDATAPNDAMQAIAASEEPVETVFAAGDFAAAQGRRIETRVSRPYLLHGAIGPSAALAEWNAGSLTIWSHSQGVFQLREALAMALRLDEAAITVIHHAGSGAYGHNGADDVALDAALMARAVPGRPVRVVWSRADEFGAAPMGPGMVTRAEAVLDAHGRIVAMRVTANSAPHANRPGRNGTPNLRAAAYMADPILPARSTDMPLARGGGAERNAVPGYAIPVLEIGKRLVHALPYRTSSLRSLGAFANIYAIETLMDDIAVALAIDPVELRLRHLEDARARGVIEAVVAETARLRSRCSGEGSGWGLGYARYKNTAGYCAIVARVEVDEAVRVTEVHAVADLGEVINADGARNQIEGGIVQATSWTLKEAVAFDGPAVAPQTWLDYPILTFSEVPEIGVSLVERPEAPPLGCGEIAQGPMAAAIGNALRAAIGVRVRDLPLTRDAVLSALM